ncbi:MAG: LPS assembly lipoprotein LptE [Silanimonas sp.]
MRARFLVPVLAAALAVGCGFAPRGALKVPEGFGAIAVTATDPYSPLADDLRRSLQRAGADTTEAADGAARLAITAETWETRPISVDAFVAVREIETRYRVTFDLVDAAGGKRLEQQTVELTRDYVYEAAESFGNPGEQEIVQQELRRDMQAAILRRVDLALRAD